MYNVKKFVVGAIETNCYIVTTKTQCVIIDPGDEANLLETYLTDHSLKPMYILLTHAHYDHIGAVKQLAEVFGAVVVVGQKDSELLLDMRKNLAEYVRGSKERFIIKNHKTVSDGNIIKTDEMQIEVIETPGHTKGGVTYKFGDKLFVGDTLFAGSVGRTDFYGGSFAELKKSIEKLVKNYPDATVYPGHGPQTTMQAEIESNPYIGTK